MSLPRALLPLAFLSVPALAAPAPLPAPRHRTKQPNALSFPAREALHQILGVDLTQIHGLGPYKIEHLGELILRELASVGE